jgi:hypothetical protein
MAAIKSRDPIPASLALRMMQAMQEGHDNSGFAVVMQDLGGAFANFKRFPLLSMACTQEGRDRTEKILEDLGFTPKFDYEPDVVFSPKLNFRRMPYYLFRNYRYPEAYASSGSQLTAQQKRLLVETALKIRQALERDITALLDEMNTAGAAFLVVPSEYLEVVITKR